MRQFLLSHDAHKFRQAVEDVFKIVSAGHKFADALEKAALDPAHKSILELIGNLADAEGADILAVLEEAMQLSTDEPVLRVVR